MAAPLSLCCPFAPEVLKFAANWLVEFIVKGKDRMPVSEIDIWALVIPLMRLRWYTWIGAAIYFWGWIHQRRCHAILVSFLSSHHHLLDFHFKFLCAFSFIFVKSDVAK